MKNGLIVFVRKPELGQVKTRLANSIGDEAALAVYQKLLTHTRQVSEAVAAERYLFYAGAVATNDDWQETLFRKKIQQGADLGSRMHHAFETLFRNGCDRAVIIGSDCPGLRAEGVEEAFRKLSDCDVVIGPATDGGYYLLGMNTLHPELFRNKHWSTETVLTETIETLDSLGLTYALLPPLTDIDEEADLPHLAQLL